MSTYDYYPSRHEFMELDIDYGDDEVTVIVEFVPGWYIPANFRGHPDSWSPAEGSCAEVIAVRLPDNDKDIWSSLSRETKDYITRKVEAWEVPTPSPEPDDDYDDFPD